MSNGGLFAELKRRKVTRVAVAYLAVSAVAISTAAEGFSDLWEAYKTPAIGLLALGFLIALLLAWFLKVQPEASEASETAESTRKDSVEKPGSDEKKSIVVLPFDNMSPDSGDAYFCDGLTEEIITDLSSLPALRVISRNSAVVVKGSGKSTREIARELDVDYVLEGSVRKAGRDLRITAQLIQAETDEHLWAEKYDGVLDDVFGMQESVSKAIAGALDLRLTPAQEDRIASSPHESFQEYDCYLKARHQIHGIASDSVEQGIQTLKHGLELWPDSALLHAALGEAYYMQVDAGILVEDDVLDRAQELAQRSLTLQPGLAQGLKLLGLLERGRGSLLAATRLMLAAYQANPNDAGILLWTGVFLGGYVGRISLAEPIIDRVLTIDPLDGFSWLVGGVFRSRMDDPEPSLRCLRRAQELSPEIPHTQFWIGHVLGGSGQTEAAADALDVAIRAKTSGPIGGLARFLRNGLAGDEAAALAALDVTTRQYAWGDPDFSYLMPGYLSLIGRTDEAIEWLQHAVDRDFANYPYLAEYGPYLEGLRGDARFKEILERVRKRWKEFEMEMVL